MAVIDGARAATHILFPRIRSRLAPATRMLLTTKSSTDFGATGRNIDIDDPAIRSLWPQPLEDLTKVLGKHAGRKTLIDAVVDNYGLIHVFAFEYVENWSEAFVHHNRIIWLQTGNNGRLDEKARTVHYFA